MNRALSATEVEVLRFLVSDGRPGADRVLASLPYLRVVAECGCGCATVDLRDLRSTGPWERQGLFAEAFDESTRLVVHVLVDEERLVPTCLEVYGVDGDGGAFPSVSALTLSG